jgi:hypothetical protein
MLIAFNNYWWYMTNATTVDLDLQQELDGLKTESEGVRHQIKVSSTAERKFFAKTYVWWRKAREAKDYLSNAYSAKGIKYNATQNRINWRPLLKLVSDSKISRGDLDTWSSCFDRIHGDFEQNPEHYAANPVAQIDYYIESNGGKTGLAGYHDKKDDLEDVDDVDGPTIRDLAYDVDDDELSPVFLTLAKSHYASSQAVPLPLTYPAQFNEEQFGIALVRKGVTSNEYVTASNLSHLVDTLLQDSYRSDFAAAPMTMRCILEPIHIANVPLTVSKNLDRFIEYSRVQIKDGTGNKLKAAKRIIYRAETNDFLLSLANLRSSLCVIAKPSVPLFNSASSDLVLTPFVQRSTEVRLLHQRMANIFAPSNFHTYDVSSQNGLIHHFVRLAAKPELVDYLRDHGITEEQMLSHVRNLKHDSITFLAVQYGSTLAAQAQPMLTDFVSTWKATVRTEWLRNAVTSFFDRWIVEYGIKSKRAMNRVMSVDLDSKRLNIGYELSETLGFASYKDLPLHPGTAAGGATLVVRSTDFAFALRQIVDLPIIGDVKLSASDDVIVLSFETTACSYSVTIPACDDVGSRKVSCFSYYHPTRAPQCEDDKVGQEPDGPHFEP